MRGRRVQFEAPAKIYCRGSHERTFTRPPWTTVVIVVIIRKQPKDMFVFVCVCVSVCVYVQICAWVYGHNIPDVIAQALRAGTWMTLACMPVHV